MEPDLRYPHYNHLQAEFMPFYRKVTGTEKMSAGGISVRTAWRVNRDDAGFWSMVPIARIRPSRQQWSIVRNQHTHNRREV